MELGGISCTSSIWSTIGSHAWENNKVNEWRPEQIRLKILLFLRRGPRTPPSLQHAQEPLPSHAGLPLPANTWRTFDLFRSQRAKKNNAVFLLFWSLYIRRPKVPIFIKSVHNYIISFDLRLWRLIFERAQREVSMAARTGVLLASALLLCCLAGTCYGIVLFSSLPKTLVVTASPKQGQGTTSPLRLAWNEFCFLFFASSFSCINPSYCFIPMVFNLFFFGWQLWCPRKNSMWVFYI